MTETSKSVALEHIIKSYDIIAERQRQTDFVAISLIAGSILMLSVYTLQEVDTSKAIPQVAWVLGSLGFLLVIFYGAKALLESKCIVPLEPTMTDVRHSYVESSLEEAKFNAAYQWHAATIESKESLARQWSSVTWATACLALEIVGYFVAIMV